MRETLPGKAVETPTERGEAIIAGHLAAVDKDAYPARADDRPAVAAIPDRRRHHRGDYRGQIYPLGAGDYVTRNPPDLRMRGGGVLSALD
jgi:hypothetical protein